MPNRPVNESCDYTQEYKKVFNQVSDNIIANLRSLPTQKDKVAARLDGNS